MSAIQLSFSLRVSSGVKTVHLLGSWDNYSNQLPLSKDKSSSKGTWKGTFRFQQTLLQPGQRYWYYYIIDGYHVAHNPSEDSTVEPTTGRTLNILDVPKSSSSKSSSRKSTSSQKSRASVSGDIPKGRPLSISQIKAPKPVQPNAARTILTKDFDEDELSSQFAATAIYDDEYYYDDADGILIPGSPASSVGSSLSYNSDSSGTSRSSGYSTPSSDCSSCTCERYGITRKGERVRLDCGGSRCSYDDSSSSCSSSEDEAEYVARSSRRNGIVVRH
ncbi:hypothetical protein VTJ83DRAFT_7260 [Remersonia thermophila]|uniref:GTP-binding protein EsdC n=1 Tax=Remersonia thermophila TaxID=72144 RepID=A0ABR4D406_9PEZI